MSNILTSTEANHSTFDANQTNIIRLLIEPAPQEKIIINVLKDQVLWQRITAASRQLINAAWCRTDEEQFFMPDLQYTGYTTALDVMGISGNEDLCDELGDMLYTDIEANPYMEFSELANLIYANWIAFLKQYSLSNIKSA